MVFNIDGLPLFKSSGTQLWPILAYFNTFDKFIIAIHGGDPKPSPLSEFLEHFVNELSNLIQDGFDWNGKHFGVTKKCFLCDALARAFLKGIISHTGYSSCENVVFMEVMKVVWYLMRKLSTLSAIGKLLEILDKATINCFTVSRN